MLQTPKLEATPVTGSLSPAGVFHSERLRIGLAVGAILAAVVLLAVATARAPQGLGGASETLPTLSDPRVGETQTRLPDGTVLVAGGQALDGRALASAELYHPRSRAWTVTASMHVARWHHTATLLLDGKVLVAGGTRAGDGVAVPEVYDPRTGTWTLVRRSHLRAGG